MLRACLRCFAALALWPAAVHAEPIKLKLAFFSSDRTHVYRSMVKPFVDAVNAEGRGRVEIEVHLAAALGRDLTRQSQLAREGVADIAYVIQPYERASFPDSPVIELPGIFRDGREATLAYSHLVSTGLLRDFADFHVIGVFASEPESLHLRTAVAAIGDLKGRRIRANNDTQIAIFKALGITPVFVPITETANAISKGKIDGAAVPPVPMMEFGIGRVAPNHFMLGIGAVPLSVIMTRKRFEALPADIQALIRKHGGIALRENYIRINESSTALVMTQLESDPRRKVVIPSAADMQIAGPIFRKIVDAFAARDAHAAALVDAARRAAEATRVERRDR